MLNAKNQTLKIDGSTGEGGGQIIRSALTLSMLTGTPIEITNIRAGRAKSGLMRQHLMCVQASQQISNAKVTGAHLGSMAFNFTPDTVQAGDYTFDIGSAGSTSLVLQTLLPALLFANANTSQQSTLTITGGTHNPLAPTTDFLQQAFVPLLGKLGMQVDIECLQAGFAPVGGGSVRAVITPFLRRADTKPLELSRRGQLSGIALTASILNLEYAICRRELASATAALVEAGIDEALITTHGQRLRGIGEGNVCHATVTHQLATHQLADSTETHQEIFTVLGEKRMSAEKVGKRLAGQIKRYLYDSTALVDEYLTDQLLLPLALAGGGGFTARMISEHSKTQAWLIAQFLPVEIDFETLTDNHVLVKVQC